MLGRARHIIVGIIDFFHRPFVNLIPTQTFRYLACGGSNTVLNIFLESIAFNHILHGHPVPVYHSLAISPELGAWALSFPITFTAGFIMSRHIVFPESNLHGHKQLFRYALTTITFLLMTVALIEFGKDFLPMINQTVRYTFICIITAVLSYISQRVYTFKTIEEKVVTD